MKIDFQKAYDRMEWSFLAQVLNNFGFCQQFIKIVYQCISTVRYTILIKGGVGPTMTPARGLRQGDPLSPYLFILGSEVLARVTNKAAGNGAINGVKLGHTSLAITKLMYADDVILICKAKQVEVSTMAVSLEILCLVWSKYQSREIGIICLSWSSFPIPDTDPEPKNILESPYSYPKAKRKILPI